MQAILREASKGPADVRRVMEWRHDPLTQEMSIDSSERSFSEFWAEFLGRYPEEGAPKPVFMEVNREDVAFVRFDPPRVEPKKAAKSAEISINVAPKWRGQGHGLRALELAEAYLAGFGFDTIIALVKVDNLVSRRLFERAGYVDRGRNTISSGQNDVLTEVICYVRQIP